MDSVTERLGNERIGKLLVAFALPSVCSLVLNALYNMVDQIFIGQGVGYLANGATNVIFPLTQLAVAIGLLLGDGAAAYMNLKQGERDKMSSDKGLIAGLAGLIASGVVLFLVYNIFLEKLCYIFGATEATLPYAIDYGRIISLGILFCVFSSGGMSIVRAMGKPKLAMMGMVLGCIVNLIGDPLCIFAFHMGVKGAALATILGQILNALVYIVFIAREKDIEFPSFKEAFKFIPRVSKLGISSFVTQLSVVIVIAVQNNLLVHYGALSEYGAEIPMTSLGVTMKVFTVLQCAVAGLMAGAQPIISYNYGSRKYQRVKETLLITIAITEFLMIVATLWFQLAPMSIVSIFGSESALYNRFAVKCLRVFLCLLILDGFQMVASSYLQSIGKPFPAAMLVLLRQIVVSIPAAFIMAAIFGVEGVLYSGPIAGFIVGITSICILLKSIKSLK